MLPLPWAASAPALRGPKAWTDPTPGVLQAPGQRPHTGGKPCLHSAGASVLLPLAGIYPAASGDGGSGTALWL